MSRRWAVKVLNEIFNEMSLALAQGETVAFPFGKLKVMRHKHRQTRGWFLEQILVTYKQPFTVVHVTDAKGERLLEPQPIKLKYPIPPKPVSGK
jgi:hypothetical protein